MASWNCAPDYFARMNSTCWGTSIYRECMMDLAIVCDFNATGQDVARANDRDVQIQSASKHLL
jgi:hypothetical protein